MACAVQGVGLGNVSDKKGNDMLGWTLMFLIIALIAGVLGFTGIAGAAMGIAKIIFVVFLFCFWCLWSYVLPPGDPAKTMRLEHENGGARMDYGQ